MPDVSRSRTMAHRIVGGCFAVLALFSILTGDFGKGIVLFLIAGVFVLAERLAHPAA